MQKDNFKQQFWISVSVIFGSIIIASVVLYFLANRIGGIATAVSISRATTAGENAEFQDLANLKQKAAIAATYQTVMNQLMASQEALITFPTQIDALGRADGVSTSFSFQNAPVPPTATTPGSLGFSLNVSGPLTNVISFMKDFESTAPVLLSSLDDVTITGGGSSYTLTAQGTVFFKQ